MEKVRIYADAIGVQPSTVAQTAGKVNGKAWSRWEAGEGSPTLRTADKILKYMAENPVPVPSESAEHPVEEPSDAGKHTTPFTAQIRAAFLLIWGVHGR